MNKLFTLSPLILILMLSCVTMSENAADFRPQTEEKSKFPRLSATPDLIYKVLLADIAAKRGHLDLAKKHYDELAIKTKDPRLVERAARIAFIARDNELALKHGKLWVEVDPENLEARKLLSVLLIKTHRTKEAVVHLEKLVADYWSNNLQGFMLIARILGNEKDSKIAFDVMQKLVERHPDVPEAQFALAELAMRAEDMTNADTAINRVLKLKPGWPEAIIFKARVLQSLSELPEALAYLDKEIKKKPDSLQLRLTYARLLLESKHYTEARQQFKKLAELAPDNDDILYALGGLSLEVKQYKDAEFYLKKLIVMKRKVFTASYFLGQTKEQQKQYGKAIEWYRKVERGEHYLSAQIHIAMIYARQGDQDKAKDHLDTITAYNKTQRIRLHIARGEVFRTGKHYKKEFAAYDKGLKKFPESTNLLYARALAAEKIGDLTTVEADLRKIIKNEPENAAALNALGYTLADRTNRYQEAMELIKRALELKPDDPAILDSMGWVNYRLGQFEEAEKYLRMAIKDSEDAEIAAHLGEVLWVGGKRGAAKKVWAKARQATPDNDVLEGVMQKYGQL